MDRSSRWIVKEIAAVARIAATVAARVHAGEVIPAGELLQLQRCKVGLLEAINRRPPYKAGAEDAVLDAEQELQRLQGLHSGARHLTGGPEVVR